MINRPRFCAQRGARLRPGDRFCGVCGRIALGMPSAVPPAAPRPAGGTATGQVVIWDPHAAQAIQTLALK
jgi:hypothetical protein